MFTIIALNPGRSTFGVVGFVFGVSGRCGPVFVEDVAAGALWGAGLAGAVVALCLLDTLPPTLATGSICCARTRKSASEASSK